MKALTNLLATAAPDDASPIFPGLTNFQAPLLFGASTFVLVTPRAPLWHFVAGEFDASGLPTGLLYSDADRWNRFLGTIAPHMPNKARFESAATICDEDDLTIDDYLTQISVPILYVGAAGAFGDYGDHTGNITASSDVTNYTVQRQPDDLRAIDYGHADLFLADDADALVWEVMRKWIVKR